MEEISLVVGFLLILSGITFFVLSPNVAHDYLLPYWFASLLVITSGVLFIVRSKGVKVSLYVCGQCNRSFVNEHDLRRHYVTDHVKKDSN